MARVLVAEDDPDMRKLVVEALEKDGHDVRQAADGGELLAQIAGERGREASFASVDVVVSDVRMPGYSGLEMFERLFDARWRIPVILMTAFGDRDTRRRAERVGAILFDKPLVLEELRVAVNRLSRR
jgi:two-component system response regulator (stage 0 sporulation protein F)